MAGTRNPQPDVRAWPDPWPAPAASGPVRARVTVPGSKSITNRALILAALAGAPTRIVGKTFPGFGALWAKMLQP
jgi:hypothetical protein